MVWSAMSRDRDPGSPETGHHRLHNVRCSTMPTVAPAPPPRRPGLGRCRRGAQDRSRWCGIDCGADTRDSRGVDPAVRVSGAGGGVARQFERGAHLDGPSHEVSSGLGEDPGGRTGGHRGGSASKAAALAATTRRRIRTGRGRLELGCVDRACRRPRRRPGTGPRLPVPGARRRSRPATRLARARAVVAVGRPSPACRSPTGRRSRHRRQPRRHAAPARWRRLTGRARACRGSDRRAWRRATPSCSSRSAIAAYPRRCSALTAPTDRSPKSRSRRTSRWAGASRSHRARTRSVASERSTSACTSSGAAASGRVANGRGAGLRALRRRSSASRR